MNIDEFKKFKLDAGDLEWNDYDLCFSIADLYENNINHNESLQWTVDKSAAVELCR